MCVCACEWASNAIIPFAQQPHSLVMSSSYWRPDADGVNYRCQESLWSSFHAQSCKFRVLDMARRCCMPQRIIGTSPIAQAVSCVPTLIHANNCHTTAYQSIPAQRRCDVGDAATSPMPTMGVFVTSLLCRHMFPHVRLHLSSEHVQLCAFIWICIALARTLHVVRYIHIVATHTCSRACNVSAANWRAVLRT